MKRVVIHQPMFFPWIGLFEQIKNADIYLHYDDVIMPLSGGLMNRIKIKTANGSVWMTIPIVRKGQQLISDVIIKDIKKWKKKHIMSLEQNYAKTPFVDDMMQIVSEIYSIDTERLIDINICAIERIAAYYNINAEFRLTSEYEINSKSSEKVLELVKTVNGNIYITGHGASNYLDHELFEKNNIKVEYMNYKRLPYPQIHGEFDPHISILDLIANTGTNGIKYICSDTIYWKDFFKNK